MDNWIQANQRYLISALAVVRQALERHATRAENASAQSGARTPIAEEMSQPAALETLCALFGLSPFERNALLLCAGIELDAAFPALCAAAQGDPQRAYPTFSLALAVFPEAHWSALVPEAPLRRWRLIEIGAGSTLTLAPLRIDERTLHYLAGVSHMDERLAGLIEPLRLAGDLVPSHHALAERIAQTWTQSTNASPLAIFQLCGDETIGKRAIAAHVAAVLHLKLHVMSANSVPLDTREREALIRLWEREAVLGPSALLIDCDDIDSNDAVRGGAIDHVIDRTMGALILTSRERRRLLSSTGLGRALVTLDVHKPTTSEQRAIWQNAAAAFAPNLNGKLDALVSQFNLSAANIRAACAQIDGRDETGIARALWDTCRVQARPRLNDLAQRIEPTATWEDLILPKAQSQILRDISAHVRQRHRVYETWGFAAKSSRGLGINALFTGASGTGKTMAAEVLANELHLDLYRIDLASVVSKYIGETEKNLRRVFDVAEDGGAILLFDEADALFGKRSEIRDSHDRYANIEVSYLLQRMEAYRGLAILTTNMKEALDTAFLRRIRFIVYFSFPDAAQRAEIWRRIFPANAPTEGLDTRKLSQLNVAGGNIRNIALNAAFLAADVGEPVRMTHLLHAARSEYAKLERSMTDTEVAGWI